MEEYSSNTSKNERLTGSEAAPMVSNHVYSKRGNSLGYTVTEGAADSTIVAVNNIRTHDEATRGSLESKKICHDRTRISLVTLRPYMETPDLKSLSTAEKTSLCFEAIHKRRPDIVQMLMKDGLNANCTDERGISAIHSEVNEGSNSCNKIIDILIQAGADINCKKSCDKSTVIQSAIVYDKYSTVERLIEAGADVNLSNALGRTALHIAAIFNQKEIVSLLIKSNADVNLETIEGNSALNRAIDYRSSPDIIEQLLLAGADVNHRESLFNRLPLLQVVEESGTMSLYLFDMLIKYGADINLRSNSKIGEDYLNRNK